MPLALIGPLKLGVIPTLAPYLMPLILKPLKQGYPGMTIELWEDQTRSLIEGLRNHRLDAALLATETDAPEITEIVLAVGFFYEAHGHPNNSIIHAGGWIGVLTAAVAWYASAALVSAGMNEGRALLPVGRALWTGDRFSFGRERPIAEARPS